MIKLHIDSHDLSAIISRFTTVVTEAAGAAARHEVTLGKLYNAEDTIRDLKAKLSKYEPIPGFPMPTFNPAMPGVPAANKIGLAMKEAAGGNRIAAIKIVRELTGCGLKEAKDAVEIGYPPNALPAQRW